MISLIPIAGAPASILLDKYWPEKENEQMIMQSDTIENSEQFFDKLSFLCLTMNNKDQLFCY